MENNVVEIKIIFYLCGSVEYGNGSSTIRGPKTKYPQTSTYA